MYPITCSTKCLTESFSRRCSELSLLDVSWWVRFFFIKCLGNAGLVEEASFVFDRSTEMGLCVPNEYTYNCLLEAISRSNSSLVDLVETRLEEMRRFGFRFDKFTLTPVLQAYCNAGECERAQSLCWFYTKLCWRGLIWCKMLTIFYPEPLWK